jgi:predicted Fe-Mo cluster-binding NifX family protein
MIIAMPLENGRLAQRFGRCEAFLLINVDDATKTVSGETTLVPPPHEPGLIARWIREEGADVVIARGMGRRAQRILGDNGARIVVGAPDYAPAPLVARFLMGNLTTGENECDE